MKKSCLPIILCMVSLAFAISATGHTRAAVSIVQQQRLNDRLIAALKAKHPTLLAATAALEAGAQANARDADGTPALTIAVGADEFEIAKLLLGHGASVNEKDHDGQTALSVASDNGSEDAARLLVKAGANINAFDSVGTALAYAVKAHDVGMVMLLLSLGANPDVGSLTGITPLMKAAYTWQTDVVKILLNHEANPNIAERGGFAALQFATQQDSPEIMSLLLEHGADPNTSAISGTTPLWIATGQGRTDLMKILLDKGARVDTQGLGGQTALYAAVNNNQPEALNYLLNENANPNLGDSAGLTPLYLAAENQLTQFMDLLIAKGADVNMIANDNKKPLLSHIAETGSSTIVAYLVQHGANVNALDAYDSTPLIYAVIHGDKDSVKILLDKKANFTQVNKHNETALSLALRDNKTEIADMLRAAGETN